MRQTTYPKGNTVKRTWYVVDAQDCVLGRIASRVAAVLLGKEKNELYTPYANNASGVIIINAEKIQLTTDAKLQHPFFWHTGYPGIKQRTIKERLNSKDPGHVLYKAIERMIPRNPRGRALMRNLRVCVGAEHSHSGLQPIVWNLRDENRKNLLIKGTF
jgi:large subunit ribosomal protein L13